MTAIPHTIDADSNLIEAQSIMSRHGIRHLPVLLRSRLVGIISDRDIRHYVDPAVNLPRMCRVGDVMTPEPYVVAPNEPLDQVLLTMAERRIGCVVVASNGTLEGIFTMTDASRLLGQRLRDDRSNHRF
jgi:acetoin utilization protein AcuB